MASRKAPTPIRMRVIRMASTTVNGRDKTEGRALPLHAAPLITVSGTKWLLDGSPIERTAAMRKPYTDLPSTSGELDFPEKEMEAMLRESLQNDDQLMVHATGDRATEMFLNAMDATGGPKIWASKRVRIEHGDGIMPELIARVKGMGLIVVENPTHLALRELFVRRFGVERADQMQPMRSLLDAGIPLAIGSDGPNNPYLNIMLAWNISGKAEGSDNTRASSDCVYVDIGVRRVCRKGQRHPGAGKIRGSCGAIAGYFQRAAAGDYRRRSPC